MKKKIKPSFLRFYVLLRYMLFWFGVSVVGRLWFMIVMGKLSWALSAMEWLRIFLYGFKHDISISAYLVSVPALILTFGARRTLHRYVISLISFYTLFMLLITTMAFIVDAEVYSHWHSRLDFSALTFIRKPDLALASSTTSQIIAQCVSFFVFFSFFMVLYFKTIRNRFYEIKPNSWKIGILSFLFTVSLIIPIRGSFDVAPVNLGSVYHSDVPFANHAAINAVFNFGQVFTIEGTDKNPYIYFEDTEAQEIFHDLFKKQIPTKPLQKFVAKQPNVILIILESFTAKWMHVLGGKEGVTPHMNALSNEGILFNNFYASGDRTNRGILAILGSYPSQPKTSMIFAPQKIEKLHLLGREMKKLGYNTSFYYGGDTDFASVHSFLVASQFEQIITRKDFDPKDSNSKWGIHDHIVFKRFLDDTNQQKKPFFQVMLSLSSHEPFETPTPPHWEGFDEETLFKNSIYYTDACIGEFIAQAKKQDWWSNTLIILTADHGAVLPDSSANFEPKKFHIPMLWLGGALLKKGIVISEVASQTDIAPILLNQLGENTEGMYPFSKDILKGETPFAFYTFDDGMGWITPSSSVVFEHNAQKWVVDKGDDMLQEKRKAKAFMQVMYEDFIKK